MWYTDIKKFFDPPMNRAKLKEQTAFYLRTTVFGIEDSLVSTVGLLSGIAIANVTKPSILISGIVLIFVEAFSMGAGSFLSEHSSEEFLKSKEQPHRKSIIGGVIMFISYFFAGFVPLSPYFVFGVSTAFYVSIIISVMALFILGSIRGRLSKVNVLKAAWEMTLVGSVAIALGVAIGTIFKIK